MSEKPNGFTQKEMLMLLLEGQEKLDKRIDQLHEKVNTKISRQELSGWLVAVSAFIVYSIFNVKLVRFCFALLLILPLQS